MLSSSTAAPAPVSSAGTVSTTVAATLVSGGVKVIVIADRPVSGLGHLDTHAVRADLAGDEDGDIEVVGDDAGLGAVVEGLDLDQTGRREGEQPRAECQRDDRRRPPR